MIDHAITLHTRDGQQIRFDCVEGSDLLTAAEQASILLPSQCHNGSCGACTVSVHTGTYTLGDISPEVLTAEAVAHGKTLLCRTFPTQGMVLHAPYDYGVIRFDIIPERDAVVAAIDTVAVGTYRLSLQLLPDDAGDISAEFEPGQYMEIRVPGSDEWRAYSLANISNWDGHLEFIISLRPGGAFSRYLEQARLADVLHLRGPLGAFMLQENSIRPRCFVAGGTGLTPFLSMLRRMVDQSEIHSTRLFFAVRYEEDLFFREELALLTKQLPGTQVVFCVSRPNINWDGYHGNVLEALHQYLTEIDHSPDIYVCGSTRLVHGVTEVAGMFGIAESNIFTERFVSSLPQPGAILRE